MEKIVLNGEAFIDKKTAHAVLKEKLELPDYYGNNLDALWDALSFNRSKRIIIIRNPQQITANLGKYGAALLQIFTDLDKVNRYTIVVFAYKF